MQDYILRGVVLKAIDWKEKDKLITIYTLERGVLTANLRGVRQQKSKLKFATQPLCFAEFSLTGNGDILTCTNASEIESFFAVSYDYDKMVLASAMLEMVYLTATREPNVDLFVSLIRALGGLCDDNVDPRVVFTKFGLQFFAALGYAFNFDECKSCQKQFDDLVFIDLHTGAFVCNDCITLGAEPISMQTFRVLNIINNMQFDELSKVKITDTQYVECKNLIIKDFGALFDKKLKSITL